MEITKVVELWQLFQHAGLHVCIDGGWAVDAVLGEQTRPHSDLDIALPASEVPALRALLAERHFAVVPSADSWAHNFVLGDAQGRLIDLHSYELHPDGSNRLGVPYIADHLRGSGSILGTRVRCVPPEWLVAFHTGYEVDDDDWHDVRLLCERFGLEVPPAFSRFRMHRD